MKTVGVTSKKPGTYRSVSKEVVHDLLAAIKNKKKSPNVNIKRGPRTTFRRLNT